MYKMYKTYKNCICLLLIIVFLENTQLCLHLPSPYDQGYPMNKSGRPVTSRGDINPYLPNDMDPYGFTPHTLHIHNQSKSQSNSIDQNVHTENIDEKHQHQNISIDSSHLWFHRHSNQSSNKRHKKNMISPGTTTANTTPASNMMPALPNNSYSHSSASASLMSNGNDITSYGGNITYDAIMRQPSKDNNLMLETPVSGDDEDLSDNEINLQLRLQSSSGSLTKQEMETERRSRSTSYFERAKNKFFNNSISDFFASMTRNKAKMNVIGES